MQSDFTKQLSLHFHIFGEIYEACGRKFSKGCGSYLFDGQTYDYCNAMYKKQELLYNSVQKTKSVLEIGVYMGHSILIMLLANPTLRITCIDIDDTYAKPSITVLAKRFPNATITFIHSDSLSALPLLRDTFDFFHIDGHHDNQYITNEFEMIKKISSNPTLRVIFDDQEVLPTLQRHIEQRHTVLTKVTPDCPWNNVYFELKIN